MLRHPFSVPIVPSGFKALVRGECVADEKRQIGRDRLLPFEAKVILVRAVWLRLVPSTEPSTPNTSHGLYWRL
jgi:hypothetical protein